jgi:putative transposase
MGTKYEKIRPGSFAHICNRATGNEVLFRRKEDYHLWLGGLEEYIVPIADIHAFCLLANHYHLVLQTHEDTAHELFSKQLGTLQSCYTKHNNHIYQRIGGLFISPFNRILIKDEVQLAWTFWYTHRNPLHHNLTQRWEEWEYSSYRYYVTGEPGFIKTDFFIELFGGVEQIKAHHHMNAAAFRVDMKKLFLE